MSGPGLVVVGKKDAPEADAPHRIVFQFVNDHDIGGMKVEVKNVTPEQCAVALFYLQRVANDTADMRQLQASMTDNEVAAMQRKLERGKR